MVDGVQKREQQIPGFKYGIVRASSERDNLTTTNYSHFWNLKAKNSLGSFYNWSHLDLETGSDTDPNYDLQKVSETECYMAIP